MSTQELQPNTSSHTHSFTCAACSAEIDPIVDAYVRGYPRDLGARANGIMIYMRLTLGIDVPRTCAAWRKRCRTRTGKWATRC